MNKRFMAGMLLIMLAFTARAQEKTDTVIVPLAKSSQIIFTIKDREDIETLKHYNFQEMFQDILSRIEKNDSLSTDTSATDAVATETPKEEDWSVTRNDDDHDEGDEDGWSHMRSRRNRFGRTWQSFNFDLGTNNYLSDGKFPDNDNELYAVRPWGSWYLAASSIQRTRITRKFFLEWGLGLSWYNFKFQNDNTMLIKSDDGVEFISDLRDVDHIKSKLTVSYINASLVPVLDFGDHSRKPRLWDGYRSAFRIGIGPYIGYRIASKTKLVYKDDGREKDKNRDSFYLNNVRYGARLQIGFRSTDLFFNYDLNELFASGRGPSLNAFSFGVVF